MATTFEQLDPRRQQQVINAALDVFAANTYKRAGTEEIARKAGISKGMLFYYFQNKRALYMYVFDYVAALIRDQLIGDPSAPPTDFFEFCRWAARKKFTLLATNPSILDFMVRAVYVETDPVHEAVANLLTTEMGVVYSRYFQAIDRTPFRADVFPEEILQMLTAMTEGHLQELKREGRPVVLADLEQRYERWMFILRRAAYKEEYQ